MMLMGSDKTMKIGGALMAMGVAAAVTAGVVNSKNSTKRKMKKLDKNQKIGIYIYGSSPTIRAARFIPCQGNV